MFFSKALWFSWQNCADGHVFFFCKWWFYQRDLSHHEISHSSHCEQWLQTVLSPFDILFWTSSRRHMFWLLHISPHPPALCVSGSRDDVLSLAGERGVMPGQAGWGLGCHCKQSSAYSWNEITLWQWYCFAFEADWIFFTANPLASTSFPAAPPSSLPP